jgi:hypothetical protein
MRVANQLRKKGTRNMTTEPDVAFLETADQRRAVRFADELRRCVRFHWEPSSGLLLSVAALLERQAGYTQEVVDGH